MVNGSVSFFGFFLLSVGVVSLGPVQEYQLSEMTPELFDSALLLGEVFIIRGASSEWPLSRFSCEDFRNQRELNQFQIERVYGQTDGSFVGLCSGNSFCESWEQDRRPSGNTDSTGPQFAPLYWEVRASEVAMDYVWRMTEPAWPFLSKANKWWKRTAVELWFSPPLAGAKSHVDGHVQMTAVTQLTGERRWRLAEMPDLRERPQMSPYFYDSEEFFWEPEIILHLKTGDTMVFPPGAVHDTLNEDSEACAVSITHQLGSPLPAKYYGKNREKISHLGDLREIWPIVVDLASFGFLRPVPAVSSPFFAPLEKLANLASIYDEERPDIFFTLLFETFLRTEKPAIGPFGKRAIREYLGFHDTDGDGRVSLEEFVRNAVSWLEGERKIFFAYPPKFRLARYFYEELGDEFLQEVRTFEETRQAGTEPGNSSDCGEGRHGEDSATRPVEPLKADSSIDLPAESFCDSPSGPLRKEEL